MLVFTGKHLQVFLITYKQKHININNTLDHTAYPGSL